MKRILAAVMALTLLFLASCGTGDSQTTAAPGKTVASTTTEAKNSIGDFSAQALDGQTYTKAMFADYDLTLVNIWATWCGPCISEIPELAELTAEVQPLGVNVIGIVIDPVNERTLMVEEKIVTKAKQIMAGSNADYTVLLPDGVLFSTVLKGLTSIPKTVFVDREGNLVGKPVSGARSKNQWSNIVDTYLAQVKQQSP